MKKSTQMVATYTPLLLPTPALQKGPRTDSALLLNPPLPRLCATTHSNQDKLSQGSTNPEAMVLVQEMARKTSTSIRVPFLNEAPLKSGEFVSFRYVSLLTYVKVYRVVSTLCECALCCGVCRPSSHIFFFFFFFFFLFAWFCLHLTFRTLSKVCPERHWVRTLPRAEWWRNMDGRERPARSLCVFPSHTLFGLLLPTKLTPHAKSKSSLLLTHTHSLSLSHCLSLSLHASLIALAHIHTLCLTPTFFLLLALYYLARFSAIQAAARPVLQLWQSNWPQRSAQCDSRQTDLCVPKMGMFSLLSTFLLLLFAHFLDRNTNSLSFLSSFPSPACQVVSRWQLRINRDRLSYIGYWVRQGTSCNPVVLRSEQVHLRRSGARPRVGRW